MTGKWRRRFARRTDPHYLGETFIQGIGAGVTAGFIEVNGGHSVNLDIDQHGQYRLTCNDCSRTESGTWPQKGGGAS